ncbi:MAG: DMT family transporter [Okeania sp. SIO2G4]|uniref:DMT family transporter n=1 Tax=unclassified Okeania TaxID=2634635 RepID=UPI0013B66C9D|nr:MULTISPECIES: DMT family transporter [unclassified Okeania]NEP74766.1 DMT family transporter [Okeania sp. SIO2G5]NEP95791.1 DMT family transporter [Okeania sp. SIO2F5]NEQ93569.1 DMT family transporter [Okeania sp. SIO2G4]
MNQKIVNISNLWQKIPGQIYLLLAIIIFGSSNAITKQLTEIGAEKFPGENPISFCNVLFVGNICALLILIIIYRKQLNLRYFQQFSSQDWASMLAVAFLAGALSPAASFEALSRTMVNNVILIGRIEPPLTLALAIFLLGEKVNRWKITGAIISFAGVILIIVLQSFGQNSVDSTNMISINSGEILAAIGATATAISNTISKARLHRIPVGFFNIIRNGFGGIIFFIAALYFYGSSHFMELFSPFLWQWMLVYSAVIVVIGQILWLKGLSKTSSSDASIASAFNPIAGVIAAYLILGEKPIAAHYIGGAIILVGIILSQVANKNETTINQLAEKVHPQQRETGLGFKGF